MGSRELKIETVSPDGIGAETGMEPGDIILKINEQPVEDILDYRFLIADDEVNVLVQKHDGDYWQVEIEKDWDEDLGVYFEQDGLSGMKRCRNRCIFCFVDQMPSGMRKSLYVKDDDYRLSFTHGNFITLTNTSSEDLERIANLHLSPVYVSVHTTNPRLRAQVMRNEKAAEIMEQLKYLAEQGIEIHAQAVLCPGVNDGEELKRTIRDLAGLWPSVQSLALVPVGLTAYREDLYPLESFTKEGAVEILDLVNKFQEMYIRDFGYPFLFAADEFYILAGEDFPPYDWYGGFPQVENGVGLSRLFLDDWEEIEPHLPGILPTAKRVKIVIGRLAGKVLDPLIKKLNEIENLTVIPAVVENNFFGRQVTVSGLLTGGDIAAQVDPGGTDLVVIPDSALKAEEQVFLDDYTVDEIAFKLGVPVIQAGTPEELIQVVTGYSLDI